MQLVITKRGGFKKPAHIIDGKVGGEIREIRQLDVVDRASKMNVAKNKVKRGAKYQVSARVAGGTQDQPSDYVELYYVPLQSELREAAHGPRGGWAGILPQEEAGRALSLLTTCQPLRKNRRPLICVARMGNLKRAMGCNFIRNVVRVFSPFSKPWHPKTD